MVISDPDNDLRTPKVSCTAVVALLLASVSAVLHLFAIAHTSVLGGVVAAAMAAACLWCGIHLVRAPSVTAWAISAAMATGMAAVHMVVMGSPSHQVSHSHVLHGAPVSPAHSMSPAMQAIWVVVFLEVIVAVCRLWSMTANDPAVLAENRGRERSDL